MYQAENKTLFVVC